MSKDFKRITPEEALVKVYDDEGNKIKGKLKIFLGYAPGVGKTYSMLNEANRRSQRNEDIVIGYIELHDRKETIEQLGELKIIARKKIEYNGNIMEEMDVDAIIARRPKIVLIDELAHTNVPGSKNAKRYEDVQQILDEGINVISTLNIQHIESLNDVVRQITGIRVNETIPDTIVQNANEVELIDMPTEALQNRLKRGNVYKTENIERALNNFFRKGNLNALRELALRQTAEEVDEDLKEYKEQHGIDENWHTVEKVLVCISSSPYAKKLIRRGARIAKRYKCDWVVVNVECTNFFEPKHSNSDSIILKSHEKLAIQLGAEIIKLKGKSISRELGQYSQDNNITQIVIGHSQRSKLQRILRGSTITRLLEDAKGVEVHIIPTD